MKITCNVIKDLLPLYIDNVCSDDTKILVEEHLKECEACQLLYKRMEKDIFSNVTLTKEKYVPEIKKLLQKIQKEYIILLL